MSNPTHVKKIALGADHVGVELRQHILQHLQKQGYEVLDCGARGPEPVDYPAFAAAVARKVADGTCSHGIMIDAAGVGSCIAANKVRGVRAAVCHDVPSAGNSRQHNDANVLILAAGQVDNRLARQIVDAWLAGQCTEDRHLRCVRMINRIEEGGLPDPPVPTDTPGRSTAAEGGSGKRVAQIRQRVAAAASPDELAKYFDHTLLRPEATADDVKKLCAEAREFSFASVCVNPAYVKLAAEELAGSPVKVCTVVGFPLGSHAPEVKAEEARRAIRDGAAEIDMVINLGAIKSGDRDLAYRDILAVTDTCIERQVLCKVIIETALLTDEEKVLACQLAGKARADFVKTSTGFGPGGATPHDVTLMAEAVRGTSMGVKASGGIRTLQDARRMIEAGATRIGASASVEIMVQARKEATASA